MWSIACYPSYTPEGGVPRARRIFRRYLPAEILTYLIINFLWAGLSLWLVSTLQASRPRRDAALVLLTLRGRLMTRVPAFNAPLPRLGRDLRKKRRKPAP